jgi:SPX domain protein involved in polyphosphate accumulation
MIKDLEPISSIKSGADNEPENNCSVKFLTCSANSNGEQQVDKVNGGNAALSDMKGSIEKSPGEVMFFKTLHAQLKKAIHFFGKAEEELIIREERVREGIEIIKNPHSLNVYTNTTTIDRWTMIAKSWYRFYKDLLLLETYAIMTYCSFSKILKKHDKATGYNTRCAFMTNVVNKANFSSYPRLLQIIQRTQSSYKEATEKLTSECKRPGLHEDEKLFVEMIRQLHDQTMGAERVQECSNCHT